MDKSKQIRFLELRQRLSELKYDENLGSIESMDLVEHLLTDLINTTNSYKIVCDKEARLTSDLNLAQAQLFPLRKENARLDRENHDLHRDQINQNDVMRATVDEYNRKIRAIEHEHGHLKLVLAAKDKLLHDNEVHLKRIREAYSAVVDPKGSSPSKRVIKISNQLSSNVSVAASSGFPSPSPHPPAVQSSDASAAVVETLRSQVESLSASLKKSEDEVKRLNTAIASREQELSRSGKLLSAMSSNYTDSGTAGIMPSNRQEQLLAADTHNRRIIDQLNGQVDFLNDELAKAQQELRQVGDKLRSFEAVQMELSQRTMLLDSARKEAAQLSSKLRQMEQKLIDTKFEADQQQQRAAKSSNASVVSMAPSLAVGPETNPDPRDEEIRTLLNRVASLTAEKAEVSAEVLRLQSVVEAFEQKQSASTLNTWKQGMKGAQQKSDALISDLNKEIEASKKRVSQLTKQLTQSEDRNKVLLAEKEELSKKVKFLEKTRNQSEVMRQNSELSESVTRLEVVRDALQKELEQLRAASDVTTTELTAVKRQCDDLLKEREALSVSSALSGSEATASKAALEEHVRLLSEQREQTTRLTVELQDAKVAAATAEQKYSLLKSQLDGLQVTIQQQQTQLLVATQSIAMNRMENGGASALVEQLLADKKQLQERVSNLELEQSRNEIQRSSLQQIVNYLGLQQSEHEGRLADATEERLRILQALRDKDAQIDGLTLQLEQIQQDVTHKSEGLAHTDSAIRSLREDYITSRQVNDQQASRINQLLIDLQVSAQRLEFAEGERNQMSQQLEEMVAQNQRTTEQLSVVRQEYRILQGQLAQVERERELLQQSVAEGQMHSDQAQRRVRSGQQDYQNVLKAKAELEARIEEYKVLLSNAEQTQRSHQQKAELLAGRLKASEAQEVQLEHEIESLKAALAERDQQRKDLEDLVQQLDRERDTLQEQLDEYEDVEVLKSQTTKTLEVKLLQSQQVIDQLNQKLSAVSKELSSVAKQSASTEARLNAMQLENGNLRLRCEEMQQDVELGSRDLMNMTRETQALSSDVNDLTQDRDRLRVRVSELMNSLTASDQLRRALEIERNDLMETYRSVLQEKRKLEHELSNLSTMRQKDSQASQKLFEEVSELHAAMNAMKNNERTWINDKIALTKQLELLNDQLLRVNARLSEVEEEKRKVLQDSLGLQQTNALLNDRINKVIQRATAATEANKMLTSTLSAVERERDAVKSLVQIERQRATEMGQLVQEARTQAATKDLQLQSLRTKVSFEGSSSSVGSGTAASESNEVQTSTASASHTMVSRTTTSITTTSSQVSSSSTNQRDEEHLAHTHSD